MASRTLLALGLLSLLSGCGKIVYPDAVQNSSNQAAISKRDAVQNSSSRVAISKRDAIQNSSNDVAISKHKVVKGETLYSIAYRYGVEYRTLAKWNKIAAPYHIFVGQQLVLKPQIIHRVKRGETLYAIAFKYGVELSSLARTNRLKSPYRIFVGDKITVIPQANSPGKVVSTKYKVKRPARVTVAKATRRPKGTGMVPTAPKPQTRTKATGRGGSSSNRKVFWAWPARGKLVTTFSPKDHRKGIDIRGKVGNNVVAAEGGDVVYSGNGLLGYGNLIIIRHNSSYLSAYGHNRKLLVKEGAKVAKGQKIAEMGSTRKKGAILHFEIRRNGKPVNPVRYLPRL